MQFGRIFVEDKDTKKLIDIADLKKEDYESLLKLLQKIITFYTILAYKKETE
jgi:hypothetical protein